MSPDPTLNPKPNNLTRTLGSDQCLDVVACEGSRFIGPTRMPCLGKTRPARDAVGYLVSVHWLVHRLWGYGQMSLGQKKENGRGTDNRDITRSELI